MWGGGGHEGKNPQEKDMGRAIKRKGGRKNREVGSGKQDTWEKSIWKAGTSDTSDPASSPVAHACSKKKKFPTLTFAFNTLSFPVLLVFSALNLNTEHKIFPEMALKRSHFLPKKGFTLLFLDFG